MWLPKTTGERRQAGFSGADRVSRELALQGFQARGLGRGTHHLTGSVLPG